jgi:hypothetical protein
MKFARGLQEMLDAFEEKNVHRLQSFDERRELVYDWLCNRIVLQANRKDINIEAIDFSFTYGGTQLRPLNLYTYVLFCDGYVPPYYDWIYFDNYYDEHVNKTYYYNYKHEKYDTWSGQLEKSELSESGENTWVIVDANNNGIEI